MSAFDKSGTELLAVFGKNGKSLALAYDKNGTDIFYTDALKIMTYNVGGWYNGSGTSVPSEYDSLYYNLQNGIIESNLPDILCIEEYRDEFSTTPRTALSLLSQYYPYIQTKYGDSQYEGRAICSKYPFVSNSYDSHQFTDDIYKYYDRIDVNISDNILSVIVTHFSLTQSYRAAEAQVVLDYVSDLNSFIVCGDFNTSDSFSTSGSDYINVYKPFVDAGYNIADCSLLYGFKPTYYNAGQDQWKCLDNIITSSDIQIAGIKVDKSKVNHPITQDTNWAIDHLPLMAYWILRADQISSLDSKQPRLRRGA